jgi:hypothetical protein
MKIIIFSIPIAISMFYLPFLPIDGNGKREKETFILSGFRRHTAAAASNNRRDQKSLGKLLASLCLA